MEVQQDFKELLELFNVHKVKYLIVGGYAYLFMVFLDTREILTYSLNQTQKTRYAS